MTVARLVKAQNLKSTQNTTTTSTTTDGTTAPKQVSSPTPAPVKDAKVTHQAVVQKADQKRAVGGKDTVETFAKNVQAQASKPAVTTGKAVNSPQAQKLVDELRGQSPEIAKHLDSVMAKGTRVELVKDDPKMQTDAYFDPKSNVIKIKDGQDPKVMKDNILFESCNAAHSADFKKVSDDFNNGKIAPNEYGQRYAHAEFKATAQYVDLANSVKDKSTLPERATKALEWADKTAPGYTKDPGGKRAELERAFLTSPHDKSAVGKPASLTTPEMYTYEKLQNFQDKDVRRAVTLATSSGSADKPKGINDFFKKNVDGRFESMKEEQRPGEYQKVMDSAFKTFGARKDRDLFDLTPDMKKLANA